MRATGPSVKVHVVPDESSARALRVAIAVLAALALLWIWRPTTVRAMSVGATLRQQFGSYTVSGKTGETLTEIAEKFYGDGNRWREIASWNEIQGANSRTVVKAGTKILIPNKTPAEVASVLRIAAQQAGAKSRPVAPAGAVAAASRPGTSLSAQTAGKGDADPAAAKARKATVAAAQKPVADQSPKPTATQPAGQVASQPTKPVNTPAVTKSTVATSKPTDVVSKPSVGSAKSSDASSNPSVVASKPSSAAPKPTVVATKPAGQPPTSARVTQPEQQPPKVAQGRKVAPTSEVRIPVQKTTLASRSPRRSTAPARKSVAATVAPEKPAQAAAPVVASVTLSTTPPPGDSNSAKPMQASGVRIGLANASDMSAARGKDEPTIFMPHNVTFGQTTAAAASLRQPIAPRTAEYELAPYPLEASRFLSAGKVVRSLEGASVRNVRNLSLEDRAEITLPAGTPATVGQRFAAVQQGVELATGVRLAVPTGVFVITSADVGQPITARLIRQSGIVEEGERLVAIEGDAPQPANRPAVLASHDLRGAVVAVPGEHLLPSLQSFLILNVTSAQGAREGDEFWIVEPMGTGSDAREQRIAVLRIVRATPHGSSAIVTHLDKAGIVVGAVATRVARMESASGAQ